MTREYNKSAVTSQRESYNVNHDLLGEMVVVGAPRDSMLIHVTLATQNRKNIEINWVIGVVKFFKAPFYTYSYPEKTVHSTKAKINHFHNFNIKRSMHGSNSVTRSWVLRVRGAQKIPNIMINDQGYVKQLK